MNLDLNELNSTQQEAVFYNDGPLLILAGAGTGKTRVLTSKIAYILDNEWCRPSEILAVTFTNKAANEMRQRVALMTNLDVTPLWVNTFHSIALRILRQHNDLLDLDKNFTIIDQGEQTSLVKLILKELNIDIKQYKPSLYVDQINKIKDGSSKPNFNYILPRMDDVLNMYQTKLKTSKFCDFNDLLLLNIALFQRYSHIREHYNASFKYFLVDEYQDTNSMQNLWLKLICGLANNKYVKLTCVGDDDQSIYGWRGAEIRNILQFTEEYTEAKILKLQQNYRSSPSILAIASSLIAHNINRYQKILYTNSIENLQKVKLIKALDDKQESLYLAQEIKNLREYGIIKSYSDVAILIRAGYQSRMIEDTLFMYNIPYRVVGGLKFYDRKEIKDCIAFLRLLHNVFDTLALERILLNTSYGLGQTSIKKIIDCSVMDNVDVIEASKKLIEKKAFRNLSIVNGLERFIDHFETWQEESKNSTLANLMDIVLTQSGYLSSIKKNIDLESKNQVDNINEFLETLENFDSLEKFLEYINLVSVTEDNVQDTVNIMTIHCAKGLEFDAVFLPNWVNGVFPSVKSYDESNGVEEERRLAYVAITRAKKHLYISYSFLRHGFGEIAPVSPSIFIEELNRDYLEEFEFNIKKNYSIQSLNPTPYTKPSISNNTNKTKVRRCLHAKFGEGTIIKEEENKLTILFKNYGQKVILKQFVDLL